MFKFFSYVLSSIFYLIFGLFLILFHPIQIISYNLFGVKILKKTVEILNFFLISFYKIILSEISFNFHEKILFNKPIIFVCNHQSTFEIPILIWFLRKFEARFVGKKELGYNIPSVSYYLKNGGSVLIDRKQPEDALQKIDSFCDKVKKNNWSIVIFPEGTRSKDGTPKKFRKKGLKLILNKIPNAEIIPISINNSYKFNQWNGFPIPIFIKLIFNLHESIPNDINNINYNLELIEKKIKKSILK